MTATKTAPARLRIRMRHGQSGKPQWLLIKHRDEHAAPGSDMAAENLTLVATGRTMEEIAEGKSRVWRSNRSDKTDDSAYGRLMALRRR